MKLPTAIVLMIFSSTLVFSETWNLNKFQFTMENDADFNTDYSYTHGGRISLLFSRENLNNDSITIPLLDPQNKNHLISFAYANQMYVPYDRKSLEIVEDDRPYAGWSYIELGLHQNSSTQLDSLTLQLGIVGPSAGMEDLQNEIHKYLDAKHSHGWHNQLEDEISIQLNYMHKWRFKYQDIYGLNSVLVPYSGVNLGNVSTKLSGGALYSIGWNIPNSFGVNSMNEGSFASIPVDSKIENSNVMSIYFNFLAGVNLVAKDIFVDGNTFKDSHSVERYPANAYIGAGLSIRLKSFTINYWHQNYTKDYRERGKYKPYQGYGSLLLEYNF